MKPCHSLLTMILIAVLISGFAAAAREMPFNGEMAFHKISLTIPENFIRDSTQSTEDFWVFEKGWFDRVIMLSRKDPGADADEYIDAYMEYLHSQGVQSVREDFLGLKALRSSQIEEEQSWQEMMFIHDGSVYAVALRDGTEADFAALLDTVAIHDEAPQISVREDTRTPIGRLMGYLFGN